MSTLNVANISDGTDTVGTEYVVNGSAKAWAVADAGGGVLEGGFNVASLVDDGAGLRTFNYTSAFATANNSHTTSAASSAAITQQYFSPRTTFVKTFTGTTGGAGSDKSVSISIHGDLA